MTDSNYEYYSGSGVPIKAWTRGVPLERAALEQLQNVSALPFIHKHVAVMPDVHFGRGATVGSVIPTKGAIIPAAVGVDIGCGMMAVQTSLTASELPDNLSMVRSNIEAVVPVGRGSHNIENVPKIVENTWYGKFKQDFEDINRKYPSIITRNSPALQLGTVGGGNHFIEI